ncbi:MAG: RsmD family RNA methyltransferase [Rikenellaceae bacterium]|jgi:16S rRNA (guanine(966)-N(2))-methyltransferase RsmD|nr:RsmD family RNA methyltransferase [Rikenellaceae bacterium]
MRIISGKYKGRLIHPPKNLRARPTTDFAKENLFNVLGNRIDLEGLNVLDLFAGTGSISYEFVSRGAATVTAVEINAVHVHFIQSTARTFGIDNLFVVRANAFLYLKGVKKQFDLIFADPPYDISGSETLPDMVFDHDLLRPEGIFILEHSRNLQFDNHPFFLESRSYGSVQFTLFKNPNKL